MKPVSALTKILSIGDIVLESGGTLPGVNVAYRTWGRLAKGGGNAVLVEHALTGSADVDDWWSGLIGPGSSLDPDHDFIVAANALGSCYGTTGPTSVRPVADRMWGAEFPAITVRDMTAAETRLADTLGVRRWSLVLGGSLGGMRAIEWAATHPERVASVIAIGAPLRHSAWAIGWNAIARSALLADPRFKEGRYSSDDRPASGLAAARAVSMLSYRSFAGLEGRFARDPGKDAPFAVEDWLARHGETFVDRFDANAWLTLSRAMDTHDVGRGRGEAASVLRRGDVPALLVGISTDALYPPEEIAAAARAWPSSEYATLETIHGHDGFLIEAHAMNDLVASFRARQAASIPTAGGARSRDPAQRWVDFTTR